MPPFRLLHFQRTLLLHCTMLLSDAEHRLVVQFIMPPRSIESSLLKPFQNYTCASPSATPVPIGAVATLFNATCVASSDQATLDYLTGLAYQTPVDSPAIDHGPASADTSGHHYFTNDAKTATFNLHNAAADFGITFSNKVNSAPSQEYFPASTSGVAWLQLKVLLTPPTPLFIVDADRVGDVQQIYRVKTIGGNPPPTCDGQPAVIKVDYAAQYWFYHLPSDSQSQSAD